MNKKRAQRIIENYLSTFPVDRRRLKRAEAVTIGGSSVMERYRAHCLGHYSHWHKLYRNPFPPGARHREYEEGYHQEEEWEGKRAIVVAGDPPSNTYEEK